MAPNVPRGIDYTNLYSMLILVLKERETNRREARCYPLMTPPTFWIRYGQVAIGCLSSMVPAANPHCSSERRDDTISEDLIHRTLSHVLDIIVQRDVGEHQLELVSHQPATGTADKSARGSKNTRKPVGAETRLTKNAFRSQRTGRYHSM